MSHACFDDDEFYICNLNISSFRLPRLYRPLTILNYTQYPPSEKYFYLYHMNEFESIIVNKWKLWEKCHVTYFLLSNFRNLSALIRKYANGEVVRRRYASITFRYKIYMQICCTYIQQVYWTTCMYITYVVGLGTETLYEVCNVLCS